ncbi:DUF222 domain-containing protein [Citricoccus sp. NPDC055426]|uniref:HNH endonuclease signature motif containing protein n=1 Tax=Citricoccus sp. NPDC055426 TaxID=3155536 RepID=UPI003416053B
MATDPADEHGRPEGAPSLDELPVHEVVALARQAMDVLARRLSGPTTLASFERVAPPPPRLGWEGQDTLAPIAPGETAHGPDFVAPPPLFAQGSLPVIHRDIEDLGRVMTAIHTSLAGHAARAMEDGGLREPLLGIPGGARPFRDAPDWMVRTLRIGRPEARRRIQRARQTQPPAPELSGHRRSATYPVLAEAFLHGTIDPTALDLITRALQDTREDAEAGGVDAQLGEEWLRQGEELLTSQAGVLDAESMRHACARWRQWAQHALNPDGIEPSEALPNLQQGLSYQGKRRRFHQWKILADDLQHEVLSTIAGAATNPRAKGSFDPEDPTGSTGPADPADPTGSTESNDGETPGPVHSDGPGVPATPAESAAAEGGCDPDRSWDRAAELATDPRTRHQRQLDGLTSALMGALSLTDGNGLPDSGGGRPLVMVAIDYQTLADQWARGAAGETTSSAPPVAPDPPHQPHPPGTAEMLPFDPGDFRSEAVFTGPISPTTIRALACDADLLPVVLGGAGQVLDVGRSQRLFPARLRKAVTARDGGCTAPGCTMPAPWTEVHHVQWWTRGGPTSVDNGVLLCNRHHVAVHGGSWDITLEDGIPWFVPAPFIDPFRKPLRNHYWRA